MPQVPRPPEPGDLISRFAAFVAERYPFALDLTGEAFEAALGDATETAWRQVDEIEGLRHRLQRELKQRTSHAGLPAGLETAPGVHARERIERATYELIEACDGFLRREAITASFSDDERREMLGGMILTRATDNRLKAFFLGGEVRYGSKSFQGKGFRSLGQEAIYASCLRLRRGADHRRPDGSWGGDIVAPLIRDVGAALAMHPQPETVRMILSAQMAKAGPPMNGKDLHIGDLTHGILPPAAPLSVSSLTIAGLAFAMAKEETGRVAVTYIGEGGTSLGEWHEAINVCAARRLPAVFCIENNQTALGTPLSDQTAVRTFADKAVGYGIPGLTVDGTDPEAIAAAFAWAADRARQGHGPTLLELVSMRICGHAHHDDMLYLGHEPKASWDYPELQAEKGYADPEAYAFWAQRDPLVCYAARLEAEGVIDRGDFETWKAEAEELVEAEAKKVVEAPWPEAHQAGEGVYGDQPPVQRVEVLADRGALDVPPGAGEVETGLPFDAKGQTFLEAVTLGVGDALRGDDRVFVYGEDVGGQYGNAFLLLRPLLEAFGDRILNSPLTEAGTLGVCIGAALAGQRPIAEIQFNDFVATGFNQLVNNAAKIRYRWGGAVPMVVRMPWGGLRHAGPYHSQNTEAWFYRTPGLKIVVPSTPEDARALLAAAVHDPDPVLYYEHIALYRDPRIKQQLGSAPPEPLPLGRAALRRSGDDLALISYGAYVHVAMRVAERLATDGIEASVLDLRSLVPLDRTALLRLARHCGKVLILHEDTRTGSVGESLAAIIQEEAFEFLDAPVRILGALDTPVPYSPPLEEAFLVNEAHVEQAARLLVEY
ncbi:MAG: thiamine pyrophosphate-dependent enzyme [Acidobacteriota bacterium]